MSRLTFILVLLIVAASPTFCPADEIALFDYHGDKTQFDILHGMLDQRVANLPPQVFGTSNASTAERALLASLKIGSHGPDTLANPDEAMAWMKNHGDILSTLQGTILPDSAAKFVVFSRFTLPQQVQSSHSPVVTISVPLIPEEFANNQDSHTLVILYALTQDAKRRGLSTDYVAALLKCARDLLADISRRSNGVLGPDLAAIKADLDTQIVSKSP